MIISTFGRGYAQFAVGQFADGRGRVAVNRSQAVRLARALRDPKLSCLRQLTLSDYMVVWRFDVELLGIYN
jgi:hypothetical protein